MISISSIRTFMFCPMKLYLEENLDDVRTYDILLNKTIKELRIDLQDLFQRNLRRLTKDMDLSEIEENLSKNIEEYIKNSMSIIENTKTENKSNDGDIIENLENLGKFIDKEDEIIEEEIKKEIAKEIEKEKNLSQIDELKQGIIDETYFNMKILALKSQKVMAANDKDGSQIAELFFPTSMYSYLMRDPQLEIVGSCDKIEIINGRYFPISLKSAIPPLKGTWDSDSIELVAAALLIEDEFDTEVFVGFVDYLKLGERRPVVMDVALRKGLFRVLNEIKDVINENIVPEVAAHTEKCVKCDYREICHKPEE